MKTTIPPEQILKDVEKHEFEVGKRIWYRQVMGNRDNRPPVHLEMVRINGNSYFTLIIPRSGDCRFYLTPSLLMLEQVINDEVNECVVKSKNSFRGQPGAEGDCCYEKLIQDSSYAKNGLFLTQSRFYALRVRVVYARLGYNFEDTRAKVELAIMMRKTVDDEFKPSCQLIRFTQDQFLSVIFQIKSLIRRSWIKDLNQSKLFSYCYFILY